MESLKISEGPWPPWPPLSAAYDTVSMARLENHKVFRTGIPQNTKLTNRLVFQNQVTIADQSVMAWHLH